MRRRAPLCLFFVLACGSGDDLGPLPDGGTTTNPPACDVFSAECRACAQTLESDSAACAIDPQACTAAQDIEVTIQCFVDEGQCQKAALFRASSCHDACCDVEQANVETCTADCFVNRSSCAVVAVRELDQCNLACNDQVSCALCDARFRGAIDGCDTTATSCADTCVRTHRKS